MTVLRLPSGALWLHSATPIDPQLRAEIDALGRVEHIVAPSAYHDGWGDVYPVEQ